MRLLLPIAICLLTAPAYAQILPVEPDDKLTPGEVIKGCTADHVRLPGYSATVRKTTPAMKDEAYRRYNVINDPGDSADFKVDHRIPLSLCGADTLNNLWPHSYRVKPWDPHRKTRLEVFLLKEVRKGRLTLGDAQEMFRGSWIAEYRFHFGMDRGPRRTK